MGQEADINDLFAQMFMGGMGGMGGMPGMGGGGRPKKPRRGPDEESKYNVSLEDLYKGKTVKFAANKKVVCGTCHGSGGKEKVKSHTCDRCKGDGLIEVIRQVGPTGILSRIACDRCEGSGTYYKEKDRCKKCKGKRTVSETKPLEIYIPRGSYQGERIVLEGEADQQPDQIPGDLVWVLVEEPHEVFNRIGNDLSAPIEISLAEALCGFSRVVLKHLDGRGIYISHPRGKILRPGQVLKVEGEGMPQHRSDVKGDLYLVIHVNFPEDGWISDDDAYGSLQKLLPTSVPEIAAEEVDEVEYQEDADIEEVRAILPPYLSSLSESRLRNANMTYHAQMGANSGDPRYQAEWEEDDDEGGGTAQCAQQ